MCVATAALIAGVASAGIGAAGAIASGDARAQQLQAQSAASSYQAQVARNNAQVYAQNAQYAGQAGAVATEAQNQKNAAKLSGIKVKQAASGLDVNSGSAVDVRAGEAATGRLDTLTTANNAALKVYGYRTQQTNEEAQAGLDTSAAASQASGADAARTAGYLSAGGSLLGSASSLGLKWAGQAPAQYDDTVIDT